MSKFRITTSEILLYDFLVEVKKSTLDFPFLKVILKGKLQRFFSSPFELLIQYGMSP